MSRQESFLPSFPSYFQQSLWPKQELQKNGSFVTLAYFQPPQRNQILSFENSSKNSNFQPIFQASQQLPLISVPSNKISVKIEKNSRNQSPVANSPKYLKVTTKIKKLKQQMDKSKQSQLQPFKSLYKAPQCYQFQKQSSEDLQDSKKFPEDVRECVTVKNCHRNITNKIFRLFKVESFRIILMRLCAQQNIELTEFLEFYDEDMRKNFTNIEFLTQQWTVVDGDTSSQNKLKWIFREFYRYFLDKCAINYLLLGPTRDKQAYLNTIIQMLRYIDRPNHLTTFMMSKHQKFLQKIKDNQGQTEQQEDQSGMQF